MRRTRHSAEGRKVAEPAQARREQQVTAMACRRRLFPSPVDPPRGADTTAGACRDADAGTPRTPQGYAPREDRRPVYAPSRPRRVRCTATRLSILIVNGAQPRRSICEERRGKRPPNKTPPNTPQTRSTHKKKKKKQKKHKTQKKTPPPPPPPWSRATPWGGG